MCFFPNSGARLSKLCAIDIRINLSSSLTMSLTMGMIFLMMSSTSRYVTMVRRLMVATTLSFLLAGYLLLLLAHELDEDGENQVADVFLARRVANLLQAENAGVADTPGRILQQRLQDGPHQLVEHLGEGPDTFRSTVWYIIDSPHDSLTVSMVSAASTLRTW